MVVSSVTRRGRRVDLICLRVARLDQYTPWPPRSSTSDDLQKSERPDTLQRPSVMHEPKISMSAKGKAREDTHWQLGWWDVEPLINSPARYVHTTGHPRLSSQERSRHRAIAWSRSSVIFTPHTTQPLVMARHFPSARQFILPSPAPWSSVPGAYAPPTVISVSPSEDFLFAYFPGHDSDGAGCCWKRGDTLDSWSVQEFWSLAKGAGVVTAEWLSGDRDVSGHPGSILLPCSYSTVDCSRLRNTVPIAATRTCATVQHQLDAHIHHANTPGPCVLDPTRFCDIQDHESASIVPHVYV